jgi:hypothetical protein
MSETEFKTWMEDVQARRRYLSKEQILAIRNSIRYENGWDGDDWDLALARAIEQAILSRGA